jgi:hypothetical protein
VTVLAFDSAPICEQNRGQEISLRLRTDDLKGFRKYESIKKTLLHELVSFFLLVWLCMVEAAFMSPSSVNIRQLILWIYFYALANFCQYKFSDFLWLCDYVLTAFVLIDMIAGTHGTR